MSLFGLKQIIVLSLVMLSFYYSKAVSSVCTHLNFATPSSAPLAFNRGNNQVWKGIPHTCHKLWTKICEIRQNFKWDFTTFLEIFINITLELPQYSLKSFFFLHVRSLWKPQQCGSGMKATAEPTRKSRACYNVFLYLFKRVQNTYFF